jgi:predicted site-specific integrase-resolvase
MDGYYTEEEEAKRLAVALRTLRRWRAAGYGPAITRIGRFVYYSLAAERDFLTKAEKPVALPAPRRGRPRTGT